MDLFSTLFNQPAITQLDPAQVQAMVSQSPMPFLLDVRTLEEYQEGHIREAELIPLDDLARKLSRIPKNLEVICICHSGSRSSLAAQHLSSLGYKVSNMRGGMARWARAGLPIKTGG
jgi:rhodanese-related sulfurtransferase